jgi:uncharacterized membrane protein YphA (DoxX/SURF4 family)
MTNVQTPSKAIHISLWLTQALLAAMFLMAGIMKTTQPIVELSKTVNWTSSVPEALVMFIGICEFLGGLGLILPALLKIKPNLTPVAALGLGAIQIFAIVFHLLRGETGIIGMNIILAALLGYIIWGRFKKVVITPKA